MGFLWEGGGSVLLCCALCFQADFVVYHHPQVVQIPSRTSSAKARTLWGAGTQPGPEPGLSPRDSSARPEERLVSCQGALRLTSSFRVRPLRGQGEFMAGLSEGGQRLGRARRSWPGKVIHEALHPPSRPAAATGPA